MSVDINDYSFVHKSRENRSGGGVGLYVSSNLNFKFWCNLDFLLPNVTESLFIESVKPQEKNIVTSVICRPPNQNVDEFLTMTNKLLSKISKQNKVCYLMGDFLSHLERIDWSQYVTLDDPNNAYNSFFKQYSTAYDSCFP